VTEDPSWEEGAFKLFDAILADPQASFLAVCHSFGILCRWSGVAEPIERGSKKGGKSAGIVANVLSGAACSHPWFQGLFRQMGSERFPVIDSRLFDLIPAAPAPLRAAPLSFETGADDRSPGEALTGVEFARDPSGTMPRMFGVNHHPEIMDSGRQKIIIENLWERREVTRAWYEERMSVVARGNQDPALAQQLALTTGFTFVWPLRFHLIKNLRQKAQGLNRAFEMHEDRIVERLFADRRARVRHEAHAPAPLQGS
jgi:hypothetical protein